MSSASLLLVDDNTSFVSSYGTLLAEHGFQVIAASNGAEAVTECERSQDPIELALVDMNMPGFDGPATIAALKRRSPALKVIAISGCQLSPFFSRLADLGVRDFVPKPFTIHTLLDTVQACLRAA